MHQSAMQQPSSIKQFFTVRRLVLVGLMAALVFVFTFIGFDIPSPLGKTKLHLGNVMCLLSGLLFGPLTGGLAAGIGSAIYDLMDPAWAPEFWITFINKFFMAFVAGLIMRAAFWKDGVRVWLAGVGGSVTYCVLYCLKNILSGHIVNGFTWDVAIIETLSLKLPVTFVNGIIAVIAAGILWAAIRPALKKAGLFTQML